MQDQSSSVDPEALGSEDTGNCVLIHDQVRILGEILCDSCMNGVSPKGGDAGTTRHCCSDCGGSGKRVSGLWRRCEECEKTICNCRRTDNWKDCQRHDFTCETCGSNDLGWLLIPEPEQMGVLVAFVQGNRGILFLYDDCISAVFPMSGIKRVYEVGVQGTARAIREALEEHVSRLRS